MIALWREGKGLPPGPENPPLLYPAQPGVPAPIPSRTSNPGVFKPNNSSLRLGDLNLLSTLKCEALLTVLLSMGQVTWH